MQVILVDENRLVTDAWHVAFASHPEVRILNENILNVPADAVVSPANSAGFMDGGIDRAYLQYFGPSIQQTISRCISARPEGHLPIGASVLVHTGHAQIPYLIAAPTMLMPEVIPKENVYRSFRAALRIAKQNADVIQTLCCSGMGTGLGAVEPKIAASEMASAYNDWKNKK